MEEIFTSYTPDRGRCIEHTENWKTLYYENDNLTKTRGMELSGILKRNAYDWEHFKKKSHILSYIREMKVKIILRFQLTPVRTTQIAF